MIPELTKVFTSSHSRHVAEIVNASREGGASLTILSGLLPALNLSSGALLMVYGAVILVTVSIGSVSIVEIRRRAHEAFAPDLGPCLERLAVRDE